MTRHRTFARSPLAPRGTSRRGLNRVVFVALIALVASPLGRPTVVTAKVTATHQEANSAHHHEVTPTHQEVNPAHHEAIPSPSEHPVHPARTSAAPAGWTRPTNNNNNNNDHDTVNINNGNHDLVVAHTSSSAATLSAASSAAPPSTVNGRYQEDGGNIGGGGGNGGNGINGGGSFGGIGGIGGAHAAVGGPRDLHGETSVC